MSTAKPAKSRISDETVTIRPPEILCEILKFVVKPNGGVKALLPFTRVSAQWRRAALDDSSLWTTVHLKQTTAQLLDTVLARAGDKLFRVYVDHHDFNRFAKLWKLADRIEELHYSAGIRELFPFLSSLGPAPNLKVLHLRPKFNVTVTEMADLADLPTIFSGCLPSLRDLVLTYTIAWPSGLFRGLISFDYGPFDRFPISLIVMLDTLRGCPSIELLRLVGCCLLPRGFNPPSVALPSLRKCTLVGEGTTNLVRFITIPATALVFLGKSYPEDPQVIFPDFNDHSLQPALRVLGEISAVSYSIDDRAVWLQARNDLGGVVEVEVDGLDNLLGDPLNFVYFIRSSIACWRTCPGLKTTKEFTLCIDRGSVWKPQEAACGAADLTWPLFNLPGIEGVKLHGIPLLELCLIVNFLSRAAMFRLPCPNLKQLDIESFPLHSPMLLLVELGKLLLVRKRAGMSLQSVTVKVKCEMLISAEYHRAFLTLSEALTVGSVSVEYERTKVGELRDSNGVREEEGREGEDDGTGDLCVGWDGWPKQWPKTVEEMRGK